jgi:hypothetical protein
MDSPEWRLFASHEMTQLGSDFDLATHPAQDSTASRLLGGDRQERYTGQPIRYSTSFRESCTNNSLVYSDGTETRYMPSKQAVDPLAAQTSASSGHLPPKSHDPTH